MRDTSELDRAVLAHRADPTVENHAAVLDAMRRQYEEFAREEVAEWMRKVGVVWN